MKEYKDTVKETTMAWISQCVKSGGSLGSHRRILYMRFLPLAMKLQVDGNEVISALGVS